MRYISKLLAALLLLPVLSFAQGNFKPGYIVISKGDTIRGDVNYREWNKNPDEVEFKQTGGIKKYNPQRILAFGVDNIITYESYNVSISQNEIVLQKLSTLVDSSATKENVFLTVLTSGRHVKLYSYADVLKTRYYVSDEADPAPRELIYQPHYREQDGSTRAVIDDHAFQRELVRLAYLYQPGNSKVTNNITGAFYNRNDLLKAVNAINGTKATASKVGVTHAAVRWFAGLAAIRTELKFSGQTSLATAATTAYIAPQINTGIDFITNANTGRVVLRAELSYYTTHFNAVNPDENYTGKQINIGFTPQFIYNFYNTPNFKIYTSAGISLIYCRYPENIYTVIRHLTSTVDATFITPLKLRTVRAALPLKIGLFASQRLEVYGAYFIPVSTTRYTSFSGFEHEMAIGANFLFK